MLAVLDSGKLGLNIPGVWGQSPHAFGRFEAVDQSLEVAHKFRVVEVRLVASVRDDRSVAFGRLALVAFGLVEPAKTLISVMHGGEACQYLVGGLLCRVEFPGVDEGEHGIGRGVQLFVAVMA